MKVSLNIEFSDIEECSNFMLAAGSLLKKDISVKYVKDEPTPGAEEPGAEEPAPTPESDATISKEDIRALLNKLAAKKGKEAVKELLGGFGAKNFPQLKEDDYRGVAERVEEVLADG